MRKNNVRKITYNNLRILNKLINNATGGNTL